MNKVWILLFALAVAVNAADTLSFVLHADQNGGSGMRNEYRECTTAKCYLFGQDSMKREGFIFRGWTLEKDAVDTFYVPRAKLELPSVAEGDTVTVYAKWFEVKRPKKVNSCYQIGNASELYGLAYIVNGTDNFEQETNICAELTADIVVNKNVLGSNDSLREDRSYLKWVPVGEFRSEFSGKINGKGHTISGLYSDTSQSVALLGWVQDSVAVDSLGIVGSYFKGGYPVAGIVAGANRRSVISISNSYVDMTLVGEEVGGLVGRVSDSSYVSVRNSHHSGLITHYRDVALLGGLIECVGPRSVVKIYGSYNEGIIHTFNYGSQEDSVSVGGLVGRLGKYYEVFAANEKYVDTLIIENSYNVATMDSRGEMGGLVGRLFGKYSVIRNSYNTGKLNGLTYVGGLVAWLSGTQMNMSNSYNSGALRGEMVAGLISRIEDADLNISASYNTGDAVAFDRGGYNITYASGFIGSPSTSEVKIVNSYNLGTVQKEYKDYTAKGAGLIMTQNEGVFIKNSYTVGNAMNYDALKHCLNCEYPGMFENVFYETLTAGDSVIAHTPEEFANGAIAYLLNGFHGDDVDGHVWGQKVGTDPYPVLNGAGVEGYNGEGTTPVIASPKAVKTTIMAVPRKNGRIFDIQGRAASRARHTSQHPYIFLSLPPARR